MNDQVEENVNSQPNNEPVEEEDDDDFQVIRKFDSLQQRKQDHGQKPELPKVIKKEKDQNKDPSKYSVQYMHGKTIRDLFKRQKFAELVTHVQENKGTILEYDEVKYHGEVYKINQNIMVNNASNQNDDYIAKIIRIIQIKEVKTQTYILLAEVKWYYKKNEIVRILPQHKNWISQYEIFVTDQIDYIQTTAINGPCTILSINEYENLDNIERGIYFTRLGWLPKKGKLDGFEKLTLHCICKQPINPDLDQIQCDKCDEWYHMACVGVKKGGWDQQQYCCGRCR